VKSIALLLVAAISYAQSSAILISGKDWELLGGGYQLTADSAVDRDGRVYCTDHNHDRILTVDLDGKITVWKQGANGSHGIAYGPDGRLYAGQHDRKRIVSFTPDGKESVVVEGVQTHHLKVSARGYIYFADPPAHRVWMADTGGHKRVVHEGIEWPRGLCVSPDQARLAVNDAHSASVWRFEIQPDGSLVNGRVFYRLSGADPDPGGMTFDTAGFLYVATRSGVQVFDRAGRAVTLIEPPTKEELANVFFGGRRFQWLYVTDGDKLYRRRVSRRGPQPK
jgi:gluconolactonase